MPYMKFLSVRSDVFRALFFACFLAVQKTSHKLVNFLFFSYLCILYQSSKQKQAKTNKTWKRNK